MRARLLFALGLAGCASSHLSSHDARTARGAARRAPVTLRMIDDNLRVVARGRLDGAPTGWMLDTGASVHTLVTDLAARRGLLQPGERGAVSMLGPDGSYTQPRGTRPVAIAVFEGEAGAPQSVPAVGNPGFVEAGLSGLVSPQRLPGEGESFELDLRHGVLFRLGPAAAASARSEVARGGSAVAACGSGSALVPTVEVALDGRAVRVVVETGSPRTVLLADSPAGERASRRASSHVRLRGEWSVQELALVPDVALRAGGTESVREVVVLGHSGWPTHSPCGAEGVLGLDVLRGCTLVFGASGGALACEPTGPIGDPAPRVTRAAREPLPAALPASPRALAAGVVADLGCDAVTEAEVSAWVTERHPTSGGREALVRERLMSRLASTYHLEVHSDEVDRAIAEVRARNALDEGAFARALEAQGFTRESYRDAIAAQLRELRVTGALLPEPRQPRAVEDLVARALERLARVPLLREDGRCEERWPSYYLDQVRIEGLAPADEDAVRAAMARRLGGERTTLGAEGTGQGLMRAVLTELFASRGLEPRLTVLEEGSVLRVRVALSAR